MDLISPYHGKEEKNKFNHQFCFYVCVFSEFIFSSNLIGGFIAIKKKLHFLFNDFHAISTLADCRFQTIMHVLILTMFVHVFPPFAVFVNKKIPYLGGQFLNHPARKS